MHLLPKGVLKVSLYKRVLTDPKFKTHYNPLDLRNTYIDIESPSTTQGTPSIHLWCCRVGWCWWNPLNRYWRDYNISHRIPWNHNWPPKKLYLSKRGYKWCNQTRFWYIKHEKHTSLEDIHPGLLAPNDLNWASTLATYFLCTKAPGAKTGAKRGLKDFKEVYQSYTISSLVI